MIYRPHPSKMSSQKLVSVRSSNLWIIENFTGYNQLGNYINSWKFSPTNANELSSQLRFSLRVYPKGYNNQPQGLPESTFVFLNLLNAHQAGTDDVTVQFKFAFLGEGQVEKLVKEGRVRYSKGTIIWGTPECIARDFVLNPDNGLLVNDKMAIRFDVKILQNGETPFVESRKETPSIDFLAMSQAKAISDFTSLLTSGSHFDVILCTVAGGNQDDQNETQDRKKVEVKAHKCILSARSPVFDAMFMHQTEDAEKNRVEINDISVEVLQLILKYIYGDTVTDEDLDQHALELFVAADKYQLDILKSICEQSLCTKLTTENVTDLLILADMHSSSKLKIAAIDYINRHAIEVLATEQLEMLTRTKPKLMFEIYLDLVRKMETPSIG